MRRKRRKSSHLHLAFTRERGVTREERLARILKLDRNRKRELAILDLAAQFLMDTRESYNPTSKI
jgi:hypothetical protein